MVGGHICHMADDIELNALKGEAVWLRAQLVDRDQQIESLETQHNIILTKYHRLKKQFMFIMWQHLPTTPEFQSLRVGSVEVESDTRVDEIEIQGDLGKGQFGRVYFGVADGPSGSEVALKAVPKANVRTLVALQNLANEIACMQQLTMAAALSEAGGGGGGDKTNSGLAHVVTLHRASRMSDSTMYICQSRGGSDLFQLMKRHAYLHTSDVDSLSPRLPITMVSAIARGLMAGIAAIHRAGWCHRDIKPENILIGADAQEVVSTLSASGADAAAEFINVKICDFGVCALLPRRHQDTASTASTLTRFCGSAGFFAPELMSASQRRNRCPVSDCSTTEATFSGKSEVRG